MIAHRREFLRTATGSLASIALSSVGCSRPQSAGSPTAPNVPGLGEPLQRLKDGNARFVRGETAHAHLGADWRKHLTEKQEPFATILGCSDSRVPPELVFDQGFGDLFVIRVAGNVVSPDVLGSLQYAILHLKTPLVVVLGHEKCGAVTAAVDHLAAGKREPTRIAELVRLIEPGLTQLDWSLPAAARLSKAVALNAAWSRVQLAALPERAVGPELNRPTLVSAVYDLTTGQVEFSATG